MGAVIFFGFLIIIILVIAFKSIKVVNQSEVYIIERLGKYYKTADAGLTLIVPFIDRVSSVVLLKELTMDIPPQGVITKDNVTISIDTVVFYQITDPEKSVYEIANLKKGIEYLAITTIRDIVGIQVTEIQRIGYTVVISILGQRAVQRPVGVPVELFAVLNTILSTLVRTIFADARNPVVQIAAARNFAVYIVVVHCSGKTVEQVAVPRFA